MIKKTIDGILGGLVLFLYTIVVSQHALATESENDEIIVFTSYTRPKGEPGDRPGAIHQPPFIQAMLEQANIPYKFKYAPFARATEMLKNTRNALFFPISRTPDRENEYVWIGAISPNSGHYTYLYKLKTRTDINLTDLDSARPYTIGVGRANLFRQFFERHGFDHLAPTNTRSQSLQMLLAGRIDLLSHYSFNIITTCEQANTTIDILSPALQIQGVTSHVYLVASPNSDPEYIQKLTEAYQAKVNDGLFDALVDSLEIGVTHFPAPQ